MNKRTEYNVWIICCKLRSINNFIHLEILGQSIPSNRLTTVVEIFKQILNDFLANILYFLVFCFFLQKTAWLPGIWLKTLYNSTIVVYLIRIFLLQIQMCSCSKPSCFHLENKCHYSHTDLENKVQLLGKMKRKSNQIIVPKRKLHTYVTFTIAIPDARHFYN